MSSADDVLEMKLISNELADRLAGAGAKLAARAGVVMKAIGGTTTENRALEFLRGKARRVDGWEKDNARRRRAELRTAERRQRENEHLHWIISELETTNPELARQLIDGLQHVVGRVGDEGGALAISEADADQSIEWGGSDRPRD